MAEHTPVFHAKTTSAWRKWLEKNHEKEDAVWLVYYKKSSAKKSISWSESVDEALCFGWIDSKKIKIDDETSHQFFSKRKAKSTWSKINKDKIKKLIEEGRMTSAGLKTIETAKANGSWSLLDDVEQLIIPEDLTREFKKHKGAEKFFSGLSKSNKKIILQWITLARRPETRQKRITETAIHAASGKKPNNF